MCHTVIGALSAPFCGALRLGSSGCAMQLPMLSICMRVCTCVCVCLCLCVHVCTGAFILLVYFIAAGLYCMCNMPFKRDTLLWGAKKD